MTLSLDGYDVFRRIGSNASLFPDLKAEIARLAEALVRKHLTQRPLDITGWSRIVAVLGDDTIGLVLQTLDPVALKGLVRQLDPHWTPGKSRKGTSVEKHLIDLAHKRRRRSRKAPAAAKLQKEPRARALRAKSDPARRAASPFGTTSMGPDRER